MCVILTLKAERDKHKRDSKRLEPLSTDAHFKEEVFVYPPHMLTLQGNQVKFNILYVT